MFGLIKNELIKLHGRKRYYVVLGLMLLLSGVCIFGNMRMADNMKKYQTNEARLNVINQQITSYEKTLKSTKKQKEIVMLQENLDSLKQEKAQVENDIKRSKEDWHKVYKEDISKLKTDFANQKASGNTDEIYSIEQELLTKQYYLDNEITPRPNYDLNAFSNLLAVIGTIGILFIPMLAVFIAADLVSGEYHPVTLKLLLTRPVEKWKIYFSKFMAMFIAITTIIIINFVIVFIAGGIIFGFEGALNPIVAGAKYTFKDVVTMGVHNTVPIYKQGTMYITTTVQTIGAALAYTILFNLMIGTCALAVSCLLKSNAASMIISVGVVISAFIGAQLFGIRNVLVSNPMNYMDFVNIWNGSMMSRTGSSIPTVTTALIVICSWMFFAFSAGITVFSKKEYMI